MVFNIIIKIPSATNYSVQYNIIARQGLLCREPQKSDVCASVVRRRPSVRRPSVRPDANLVIHSGPCFESNLLA